MTISIVEECVIGPLSATCVVRRPGSGFLTGEISEIQLNTGHNTHVRLNKSRVCSRHKRQSWNWNRARELARVQTDKKSDSIIQGE